MPENTARSDPLVIRSVEFLGGQAAPEGWRPVTTLPELAFAGRSNVGKSSLLNKLVRRKSLARVSQTPGKTREINYFAINDAFTLVDLPGYGYARVSKAVRFAWRPLIEGYLSSSALLRGVVQLIDARHDPSEDDLQMLEFLSHLGVPTIIAMTKIDKLKTRDLTPRLARTAAMTGADPEQLIPFSAETGVGRDELATAIVSLLEQPSWKTGA
ncbi:MAG: ribosome biogenesis GTP-binding protein YihA/YsxC [Gemmatimonadaceae bacterium]